MSPCNPEHLMNWVCTGRIVRSGVRVEVVDYSKMENDGGISTNINLFWRGVGSQELH